MEFSRILVRLIMGISTAIVLGVIVSVWRGVRLGVFDYKTPEVWGTTAAVMAVGAALISFWVSQRDLESRQDASRPYPYPSIDLRSRSHLLQLKITNAGGTVAHNIRIIWEKPLLDMDGKEIRFTDIEEEPDIPVLLPNESVSKLVGPSHKFFAKNQNANYSGVIEFSDSSMKIFRHSFFLSPEAYRKSMVHETEDSLTHSSLQDLPGQIEKLTAAVNKLQENKLQENKTDEK